MAPAERRQAALEYLREAEQLPEARQGAIHFLSQEYRTSPNAVARWDLDRRADRLSRAARLKPAYVASLVTAFHVRHRAPSVLRFLETSPASEPEASWPH